MKMHQRTHRINKLSFVLLSSIIGLVGLLGFINAFAAPTESNNVTSDQIGPYVILIGAPASGKSSNGTSIAGEFGVPLVNMGEVVTQEVERISKKRIVGSTGSERARARSRRSTSIRNALDKLEAGELVSDESMDAIVAARIMRDDARNGFVLDGYPGSVRQAEFLDGLLEASDMGPSIVIFLDVPDEVSLERMEQRAREDDKRGFGEERLRQFRTNIAPILEYYGEAVSTVDATKSLQQVEREVHAIIEKQLN
jgi:adenylate kinase